jgi:hypothetical protein
VRDNIKMDLEFGYGIESRGRAGSYEHVDELFGCVDGGKYSGYVSNC